jgi:hypothetical protein
MSLELSAKDVILVGAGLAGGGLISYLIARNVIHRSRLHYSLHPAAVLRSRDFGTSLSMNLRGQPVQNLCVFSLEMNLRGRLDISKDEVPDDHKPSIYFPDFRAFDVRTINNDESRFNIPLGIAAGGHMIIGNIDRIRANTRAIFQIIGSFDNEVPDLAQYYVDFYPGAIKNIDVETSGNIRKPWKKER